MDETPVIAGQASNLRPVSPHTAVSLALGSIEYAIKNLENAFSNGANSFDARIVRRELAEARAMLNALVRS